jgi:formylglycine-generating enzyme required for sulfatase activity
VSNVPDRPQPLQDTKLTHAAATRPLADDTANPAGEARINLDLRQGARPVADYTLLEFLGQGQFGVVWKARDDNGQEVALKFVRHTQPMGGAEVAELERMKNLGHPHLLVMHRYWRLSDWLVIALELAQGTLDQRAKSGPIALAELVEYFREAAKGLDYLHEQGLQHRDVKPANMLLVGGGIKVADFGLVKLLAATVATNTNRNMAGTPSYAAPEVWQAKTSKHSDQYALAVSWCQLRGRALPFRGEDFMALAWAHCHSDPDLSMIPAPERPVVAKALARLPDDRWPTCRAFVEALASSTPPGISADAHSTVRTKVPQPPKTSRLWYGLAGVALVMLLAAAGARFLPTLLRPRQMADASDVAGANGQSQPTGGFHLLPVEDATLRAGEAAAVAVKANRSDCRERIELAVENLPPGVTAAPAALDDGQEATQLTLTAAESTEPTDSEVAVVAVSRSYRDKAPFRLKVVRATAVRQRPKPLDCTADSGLSAAEIRRSQDEWAAYLQRNVEETVTLADGVSLTFVLVPPGRFRAGSPPAEEGRDADEALHTVVLPAPFDLGKYEVTQAQYAAVTGKNPSRFKGPDRPVEQVSWQEATEFASRLSEKSGTRYIYRLPTEAEWEFGCRGGLGSACPFGVGDGRSLSSLEANFNGDYPAGGARKGPALEETCRPGSYPPNALGLYDMHGNVWEWCADWYGAYPASEEVAPGGPVSGSERVSRGGGWQSHAQFCRSARRRGDEPGARNFMLGFRLARTVADVKK